MASVGSVGSGEDGEGGGGAGALVASVDSGLCATLSSDSAVSSTAGLREARG
ncbi:hypothetical protein ACSL103130_07750 [Actinomyces slackii]